MSETYKILNEALFEAHKQREGVFNVALTIAGGALILSLSFIEYFSFTEETTFLLKTTCLQVDWKGVLFLTFPASGVVLNRT